MLKAARGFTLIELIMVIVIIGIGLVPLVNMFAMGAKSTGESAFITVATELARKKMEDNIQRGFSSIPEDSGETFPAPHGSYTYATTVSYVDQNFQASASPSNYKKLQVTVTGGAGSLTLATVLSNHS